MSAVKEACPQSFHVWLAFVTGMVLVVLAIVVFDKAIGKGTLTGEIKATVDRGAPDRDLTAVQAVSYLSLDTETGAPDAWLGIVGTEISREEAAQLGLPIDGGILVRRVVPRSPAERAGLVRGDIIYRLNHRAVESMNALLAALDGLDPGDQVKVEILREGEREVVFVRVGKTTMKGDSDALSALAVAGQTAAGMIPSDKKWGIVVSELTPALQQRYAISSGEEGVVVVMVVSGSAAEKAGLKEGDLIQQVDRTAVDDLGDFFVQIQAAANHVILKVHRAGEEMYIHVTAIAALRPTGGSAESDDDDEEAKGYKGQPEALPPMGSPTAMTTPEPVQVI
jgi:predicted metalloprotease with PDZ domain